MTVELARFDLSSPTDTSGLAAALRRWDPTRVERLVVFAKLEGDYDDGGRERHREAFGGLLAASGLQARAISLAAVGCEGVATPFGYALASLAAPPVASGPARLVLGFARFGADGDELSWLQAVATAVAAAIADARLTPASVAQVFVKLPSRAAAAGEERVRGRRARAIAALGSAVALEEISINHIDVKTIASDLSVFGERTQAFAGPEVEAIEVIVLGNRPAVGGTLWVTRTVMADLIDASALRRMLLGAGLALDATGEFTAPDRVKAFFSKCGPAADGRVRGAPTAIYGSAIAPEKHMRAAQSGLLGGLLGTTRFFNTGDPIHAAPAGGGVACALIEA